MSSIQKLNLQSERDTSSTRYCVSHHKVDAWCVRRADTGEWMATAANEDLAEAIKQLLNSGSRDTQGDSSQ